VSTNCCHAFELYAFATIGLYESYFPLTMAPLKDEDMIDAKKIEDTHEDALNDHSLFDPVEPYCAPGFKGIFASYYVALCALFSALGMFVSKAS
jgi:hypothetical protein